MLGFTEAPQFGEKINDGDTGYKVVKINHSKNKGKDRMPKPLNELPKKGNK